MTAIHDDFVVLDRDDVSDYNEANVLPEPPESVEKITAWLQRTAYDTEGSEYRKHLASHLAGTGEWLASTEAYKLWHDTAEHGLLWMKGIPGSGKSVFAASLIRQMAEEGWPVLFFFFRQIIDANHKPVSLLRDWLCQILRFSPPLQAKLSGYLKAHRSLESLSMDDLWKDLRLALSHQSRVYVVADALDEMDGANDAFFKTLAQLGRWRPAQVKVLITSRPVTTVEMPLREIPSLKIRLEERLVDTDIATFVNYKLDGSTLLDADRVAVRKAVPGRANGLFLYARLAMDAFLEPNADVREVLRKLPADMNVMYTDLLREHARRSGVPHDLQLHIMQWVTHATKPLRLLEIAEMIYVTFHDQAISDLKAAKALVRAACGPLVEILPDETVSVIHHSFTEFLKGSTRIDVVDAKNDSYPVLQPGPTHARLALGCLRYLQSGCLDDYELASQHERHDPFYPWNTRHRKLKLKAPFVAYACENWFVHAAKAANGLVQAGHMNEIYIEMDNLLRPGQRMIIALDVACSALSVEGMTALHVAAWSGLAEYAAMILDHAESIADSVDAEGNTPLHYAAQEGRSDVVRVLLTYGAQPDLDNDVGLKPLHEAASNNKAEVAKLLLGAGVDPLTPKTKETGRNWCGNAPRSIGHTPLMYACQNGHAEVVAEFLPYLQRDNFSQALSWAAGGGHAEAVARILQHPGVDPNATSRGDSALFHACKALDRDTIEILLRYGANPNQRCINADSEFGGGCMIHEIPLCGFDSEDYKRGYSPMHAFAGLDRRGAEAEADEMKTIFELLVDSGGNINQVDRDGKTPLHHACSRAQGFSHKGENMSLLQLFLDGGANPNITSDIGETPLHLCMNDGSGRTVRVLVEQGKVDINKRSPVKGSPLLYALEAYNVDHPLRFLQYGPDCTLTDAKGNGPLHIVMKSSRGIPNSDGPNKSDLVKALLAAGADPRSKNNEGQTPLYAHNPGNLDLLPLLLNAGADLEAQSNDGHTVLRQAVVGHDLKKHETIDELIKLGARIDCRDSYGRTLMHEAVERYDMNTFQHLLSKGLCVSSDYAGNNLLHELAISHAIRCLHGNKDAELHAHVEGLIKHGVDPDQPNNLGSTPLHIVSGLSPFSPPMGVTQSIDIFLKVCTNVNASTRYGVTPLHWAAGACEYNVARLLEAGANISATTFDGLSPLHVAARCRQSNIVGMLLEHRQKADEKCRVVQMRDQSGYSALDYACRSGRYETVALLLNAGADVNLHDERCPPLQSCAYFEAEEEHWAWRGSQQFCCEVVLPPGLGIESQNVPRSDARKRNYDTAQYAVWSEKDTMNLEMIIELLLSHGASLTAKAESLWPGRDEWRPSIIDKAVSDNVRRRHDYTASCFMRLQDRAGDKDKHARSRDFAGLSSKYRQESAQRALIDSQVLKPGPGDEHLLRELLGLKQFHLVEEMAKAGVDFLHPNRDGETYLHLFAKWGYSRLLATIGSREAELKLEDRKFCEQWEENPEGIGQCRKGSIKPLLITACERELPNMDVLKVLVEEHKVDINVRHCPREGNFTERALQAVSYGTHWWHVAQALPYLLDAGADPEAKDRNGCTSLHVALDASNCKSGIFHKQAVKLLLERGADANATDDSGRNCLAKAAGDIHLLKLLMQYGAQVSASAIFAAIDGRSCNVLQALLSGGADSNGRRPKKERTQDDEKKEEESAKSTGIPVWMLRLGKDGIEEHEWYPLHYAAVQPRNHGFETETSANTKEHQKLSEEMVGLLLRYGADPYRTFKRWRFAGASSPGTADCIEECAVIHEVIQKSGTIQTLLAIPTLDPNYRDARERTLFLAACSSEMGPDVNVDAPSNSAENEKDTGAPFIAVVLLNRGADMCAKDARGWNALHYLLDPNSDTQERKQKTLFTVLSQAPHLVNERNARGDTPFHHALKLRDCSIIDQLLETGAEPCLPDCDGNSALFHLSSKVASGNETAKTLFNQLLRRGLSINARNKLGETPVFSFIKAWQHNKRGAWHGTELTEESQETFQDLLLLYMNAGASLLERDSSGQTLLHIVAAKECDNGYINQIYGEQGPRIAELFKHLVELGLDPMVEDGQQRTSLDVAAACGNDSILQMFERNKA